MCGMGSCFPHRAPNGATLISPPLPPLLQAKQWEPVIFFSFARKECELYAGSLKNFDFNTDEEKEAIEEVSSFPPSHSSTLIRPFTTSHNEVTASHRPPL